MTKRIIVAIFSAFVLASQATGDEYDRPGWYAGMGGGVAASFLSDFVESKTAGVVDLPSTGSVNVRGGYRVLSWLALEGMYEGAYNRDFEILGRTVAQSTTHSLLANTKLIIPTWRLQPYFAPGLGVQQGSFQGRGAGLVDNSRWDFMLRFGLGVDAYVTEHWLVNLELAPSIRFTDYGNVPSESTDNVSLTFSGGFQYRF